MEASIGSAVVVILLGGGDEATDGVAMVTIFSGRRCGSGIEIELISAIYCRIGIRRPVISLKASALEFARAAIGINIAIASEEEGAEGNIVNIVVAAASTFGSAAYAILL